MNYPKTTKMSKCTRKSIINSKRQQYDEYYVNENKNKSSSALT